MSECKLCIRYSNPCKYECFTFKGICENYKERNILVKDSRIKTKHITWNKQKEKYVVCKDSVYFALSKEQVYELNELTASMIVTIELKNNENN